MGRFDNMMRINAQRNNEKLTEEIKRLEDELNAAKFINCERCVEKTAKRCAEIADSGYPRDLFANGVKISHTVVPDGFHSGDEIRKQFNLPKAG